ncbi:cation diffusion facilitator family transporter, partial [Mycolicibacter arupensis]|uniref:cation diffusion facilitator family transporter n=1 Tax=Mycolicibacter arupensis TaxID=342002 RepID=UPI003B3A0765
MSSSGSTRAIIAALTANAGIAVAKFTGYVITGSAAMLAEAVHSVVDTSNQALLLFGPRAAAKAPDALHPFGHGRSRYFWSFVVALVLFSLGSMFALYEGYEKVRHPVELSSPV